MGLIIASGHPNDQNQPRRWRQFFRPGSLERHIAGISPKVLSDRLKHFQRAGIFERVVFPEIPPRGEYWLTSFRRKFSKLLKE